MSIQFYEHLHFYKNDISRHIDNHEKIERKSKKIEKQIEKDFVTHKSDSEDDGSSGQTSSGNF